MALSLPHEVLKNNKIYDIILARILVNGGNKKKSIVY